MEDPASRSAIEIKVVHREQDQAVVANSSNNHNTSSPEDRHRRCPREDGIPAGITARPSGEEPPEPDGRPGERTRHGGRHG